jgi:hypothetical protein
MRMCCRGFLRAAKVEDADAGGGRPRGSSSRVSEGDVFDRGDSGGGTAEVDMIDGAGGAVAVAVMDPVDADVSIGAGSGTRGW